MPYQTRPAQPAPIHPVSENMEARALRSALTASEYVLRGGRSHLFVLAAGSGVLTAGSTSNAIPAPCFIWLPPGRSASMRFEAGARGCMMSIPDPLLGSAIPTGSIGNRIRETIGFPLIGRELDPAVVGKLSELVATLERELFDNAPGAQTAVQHRLSLVLVELWRAARPDSSEPRPLPRNIVHNFMFLVDLHLREHWTLQRYARQLGVSTDRLNSAVRRTTGRSPLAHIHRRLMTEARTLLAGGDLQVAEVAYELGFSDAAYFNRFFQRHAGVSPGRYRAQGAPRPARPDPSFAAWP